MEQIWAAYSFDYPLVKTIYVWALLTKHKQEEVGGETLSAYCTCTAGLLSNCNPVAGLLFRIEAAVLIGVTHTICTSILASWNVSTTKRK